MPSHRSHAREGWTKEAVRCITPSEILSDWAANSTTLLAGSINKKKAAGPKRRRPHVLKISVEGHDYEVLMGFVLDTIVTADLPLMIEFEAKSIEKHFPAVKERLEKM